MSKPKTAQPKARKPGGRDLEAAQALLERALAALEAAAGKAKPPVSAGVAEAQKAAREACIHTTAAAAYCRRPSRDGEEDQS